MVFSRAVFVEKREFIGLKIILVGSVKRKMFEPYLIAFVFFSFGLGLGIVFICIIKEICDRWD